MDDRNEIAEIQFNNSKKRQRAEAVLAGSMAILRILADTPKVDFGITTGLMIGAAIATTAQQLAVIDATEFVPETMAYGGIVNGASHRNGGVKFAVGGSVAELEGGEGVINKRSMSIPGVRNMASHLNQLGGGVAFGDGGIIKYANGGMTINRKGAMLSQADIDGIASALGSQKVTVTESDITGTQKRINVLQSRASF